ncbi:MAG: hypothetical protein ACTSW1_00780 [Candidatus Hodarchaeales archaeon]
MMIPEDLLKVLRIPGQSGYENQIRRYIMEKFQDLKCEVTKDNLGSVICKIRGTAETDNKKKIALFAHMDTCGFVVHGIKSNGVVNLVNFGYSDTEACHLNSVAIQTSGGLLKGVMYARKTEGRNIFEVDIGTREYGQTLRCGVKAGDPVHFINEPYLLGFKDSRIICSPRLDNRIGLFEMLLLAQYYSENPVAHDLYFVATVEEEVGSRGAKTSVNTIKPDIAFVYDATYHEYPVFIGNGPVITLSDRSVIIPGPIRDYLLRLAEKNEIDVQTEVWNIGATDALNVRHEMTGVPTIPILTPTKNNHTPREIASINDCFSVVEYTKVLIENIEELIDQFENY